MTAIATRFPAAAQFEAASVAKAFLARLHHSVGNAPQEPSPPAESRACRTLSNLGDPRSQQIRWIALRCIDTATPVGAGDAVLLHVVRAVFPDVDAVELRREVRYLEFRGLVVVRPVFVRGWFAEATAEGAAVADYSMLCPAGIGRPYRD